MGYDKTIVTSRNESLAAGRRTQGFDEEIDELEGRGTEVADAEFAWK